MIESPKQMEHRIEQLMPANRSLAFEVGWIAHRDGADRLGPSFEEMKKIHPDDAGEGLDRWRLGWDARHRLSCAAASGRLVG